METIAGFANDGFDTIVFWPVDPSPGQLELLIADVVPQLPRGALSPLKPNRMCPYQRPRPELETRSGPRIVFGSL